MSATFITSVLHVAMEALMPASQADADAGRGGASAGSDAERGTTETDQMTMP
jgi:hypothetical protein